MKKSFFIIVIVLLTTIGNTTFYTVGRKCTESKKSKACKNYKHFAKNGASCRV